MKRKAKALVSLVLVALVIVFNTQLAFALTDETIIYDMEMPTLYESAGPNVESIEAINPNIDIDEFREYLINSFASCPDYNTGVIIYNYKIPNTTANKTAIRNYIWYETPELFHIVGIGFSTMGSYIYGVHATLDRTAEEYTAQLAEFKGKADILTSGIKGNENLTDVEKALLLHDRLAIWCQYDYENLLNGTMPSTVYEAYGAIVNGSAVCMGYALAYDYLLLQVGVDSYYCASDVLNHAWNIVYINDTPYHVDVTWDDPVWDMTGKVTHKNFLRSSEGIAQTDHTGDNGEIDYDTTPTDTTYDSYYWQNSTTAFQLLGDDIYYIDNTNKALKKISNGTTTNCISLNFYWKADADSLWRGDYSKLASDGEVLYYSTPDKIYEYNPLTGVSTAIHSPDLSGGTYLSIYGFTYKNCAFIYETPNSPNYTDATKKTYQTIAEYHRPSDWITDTGVKYRKCLNCDKISEVDTESVNIITPVGNTVIDDSNGLIFTNMFICEELSDLATINSAFTVTITPSASHFIGTGTEILIEFKDFEVCKYTVIVNGDTNGDSVCDVLDARETQLFATSSKEPTVIQIYAANGSVAEEVNTNTYQRVVNLALA